MTHHFLAVIPAKAGIHFAFGGEGKMDSRFRGNDGTEHFGMAVLEASE